MFVVGDCCAVLGETAVANRESERRISWFWVNNLPTDQDLCLDGHRTHRAVEMAGRSQIEGFPFEIDDERPVESDTRNRSAVRDSDVPFLPGPCEGAVSASLLLADRMQELVVTMFLRRETYFQAHKNIKVALEEEKGKCRALKASV
jgi:hypothetical protein